MTLSIAFDTDVTDIVGSCCASRARNADTHVIYADADVFDIVTLVVFDADIDLAYAVIVTVVCCYDSVVYVIVYAVM